MKLLHGGMGLCLLLSLSSCRVHDVLNWDHPAVCIPETYEQVIPAETTVSDNWWEAFEIAELNEVVDQVLTNNFDLHQAWDRLRQAEAIVDIEGAAKIPDVNLIADVTRRDTRGTLSSPVDITQTRFLLGGNLSYEIDLWQRIHSKTEAAWMNAEAAFEEVNSTALLLTGIATDLWLNIQEQRELLALFQTQIEVNQTFLDLVELRFSIGDASALDVFQQRLQLSQTEAQVPPAESRLKQFKNQLSILMGAPPDAFSCLERDHTKVALPPFPEIGTPVDLLTHRPDLRAFQDRLIAADYEVAAAIADRFPKLSFLLNYDFSAERWKDLFETQTAIITANLLAPLVDGGRRRAVVKQRKAVLKELLDAFSQNFLQALREVEDAIVKEHYQLKLITQLRDQEKIAEQNLREARSRYATGLSDYLPVIAAVQSLQLVQRRLISEHKSLLAARAELYRALGGPITRIEPC